MGLSIATYFFYFNHCLYAKYLCIICTPKSISVLKIARQIETENCAIDMHFHETGLICFILNAISVTRF